LGKEKGNRASGSAVFAEPIETDNIALQRAERSCLANQAAEVLQAQVLELIHYPATGATRAGLHLLFVHGAYSSASCWQPHFLPWFSRQGYDCWAVSLRGHGNSPDRRHLQQYAIADYVNDVAWACGQLAQPAVLIGHSMGGFVLQQYLRQHTAAATILLASVPPGGLLASTWRLGLTAPDILLVLNLFQQGRYQPTAEEIRRMLLSPDASLESARWLAANLQVESQRAVLDMTLTTALFARRLPCPALSIVGCSDLLVSRLEAESGGLLLGVDTLALPDVAHMLMLDTRWQCVADSMHSWLSTRFSRPVTDNGGLAGGPIYPGS
jgi:pimeloyl-ACP methyl ester carboxylesterase